ncbi:MAG: hypothetical protein V4573_00760 [Pseudomonadota bacterium]
MSTDPRQPVLVGVGTCMQREDDPALAREPMDLMLEAVRRAGEDTGADHTRGAQILAGLQHISVPKGRWRYNNPAGEIARAVGAASATTVLANVGVLQQNLLGAACRLIAGGEIDTALVTGADAGHRIQRARQLGHRAAERQQDDMPDVRLEPAEELLHPAELKAGIRMPAALYAIIGSAWRARSGASPGTHRRQIGEIYHRFSEVAAANPQAWRRKTITAPEIAEASEHNPMLAFPYTRLQCANWNVDQASALLLCSEEKARALGVPQHKWVYPLASTESNHMMPVSARGDLAACIGARLAGEAALAASGLDAAHLDLVELYSCFPIAVEAYAQELGISLSRPLTVTGGMPFAGGPFNNYVLQATCRMAELIREGHGQNGLVSSVSGILTKQGFGIWGKRPAPGGFVFSDVSADTALIETEIRVLESFSGRAKVTGYTVLHDKGQAPRALVLVDTDTGCRALAWSEDGALVQRMEAAEFCGATVTIEDQLFVPA